VVCLESNFQWTDLGYCVWVVCVCVRMWKQLSWQGVAVCEACDAWGVAVWRTRHVSPALHTATEAVMRLQLPPPQGALVISCGGSETRSDCAQHQPWQDAALCEACFHKKPSFLC
jgi:hypothetical protein